MIYLNLIIFTNLEANLNKNEKLALKEINSWDNEVICVQNEGYIENVLFELSERMPSRIRDSNHLLDIIDNINSMFLHVNAILVSFDIVNMFPKTDNKSGLDAVKSVLLKRSTNTPPVKCILEGIGRCLTCNNSVFNNRNFLQTDGKAQGLHMSCSCSDIALSKFDASALQYYFQPTLWKRFRKDILTIWTHGTDTIIS